MLKILILGAITFVGPDAGVAKSKIVSTEDFDQPRIQLVQDYGNNRISATEAADIAAQAYPDYRVIKVKYLNSGNYAVTLKADGNVVRVMVRASDGAIL